MSTRSRYLFVTPPEFTEWLRETSAVLGTHVVLFRGPKLRLECWDGSDATLSRAIRVYLTTGAMDLEDIRPDQLVPGRLGWLQLDVPRLEDGYLTAVQVAAKSDWFDADTGRTTENPVALQLFDRFWKSWKQHFRFPVWARNLKTSAHAPYRTLGYSAGAADWSRRGGLLRQQGVGNVEFFLPGPER